MYKGIIIDNFDDNCLEQDSEIIQFPSLTEDKYLINKSFNSSLEDFIIRTGIDRDMLLDGQKIIDSFFPSVKADIFISHSHKDVEKVKEFAKIIYIKTGLISFIDSEVWEFADDLLRQIDNEFCRKYDGYYSYEKRNISTSYVHMMLNTALLNMIDSCECLFFLNTPNSFNTEQEIENTTFSPWIYSELSMANTIRQRVPPRYKDVEKSLLEQSVAQFSQEDSQQDLSIVLKPRTSSFISCNFKQLQDWLDNCTISKKLKNLDDLYKSIDSKPSVKKGGFKW